MYSSCRHVGAPVSYQLFTGGGGNPDVNASIVAWILKDRGDNNANSPITGLLTKDNSTMPLSGVPVLLDPCSPYFTLHKSTCDAIAFHLPITYNTSLGLYL
ncbi:hypothetical protein N0V88_004003 [Collariella sp. IMI 366227]|nr:hypothetical protein N0V88_004003 [Collariella sp. IMI 366227]